MPPTVSVVIPAHNAASHLRICLQALLESAAAPLEIIVVDDGSTDETRALALSFTVTVLDSDRRRGPAFARNLGASQAKGDVLFFLDADICVKAGTLAQITQSFAADPELDGLIGSYDDRPSANDFISQYRNLMHTFVHQTGAERASTFWSGCGAIRRAVFLEQSGFSVEYKRPAVEDIELGYRLCRAGHKVVLDRNLQVTHLKKWTFWGLVKTDMLDRGIPWTELILRDRRMPNDLNLQLSQRISVALVFVLVGLACSVALLDGAYQMAPLLAIVLLMLARWWGEVGSHRRPRRAFAVLTSVIGVIVVAAYTQRMFGLVPPLVVAPVLLWLRHRYSRAGKLRKLYRYLGFAFIGASVCVALFYLPAHHLIYGIFAVVVLLALMNSQFYIFLAGKRGVGFMLAAIPFHILYHFYNGLSFLAGITLHYTRYYRAATDVHGQLATPAQAIPPARRHSWPLLLGLRSRELIVLFLYIATVTFAVAHYQQSEDEARAWMLCRGFPLHDLFLHILRYEGHPGLYYVLLWLLFKLGFSFTAINWAFAAIASTTTYILLRLSPFPFYLRALIPFSFFLAYQYAVVARSYVLIPLLGFLAVHLYRQRPARPAVMALVLALLANVSLHGTLVAIGLGAAYSMRLLHQNRKECVDHSSVAATPFTLWFSASLFAVSILFVAFCVWPVKYSSFLELKKVHATVARPVAIIIVTPPVRTEATLPRTGYTLQRPANTQAPLRMAVWQSRAHRLSLVFVYPIATNLALACGYEALIALLLLQRKQLMLLLPFALLSCFLLFVFVRVWHTGLIWITLLMILWAVWDSKITWKQRNLQNAVAAILFLLCLLQLRWTFQALHYQETHATYPARGAATYLASLSPSAKIDGNGIAFYVLPFFAHAVFVDDGPSRFSNHVAYPNDLSVSAFIAARLTVVLLESALVTTEDRQKFLNAGYQEQHKFCGAPYLPQPRDRPRLPLRFRKNPPTKITFVEQQSGETELSSQESVAVACKAQRLNRLSSRRKQTPQGVRSGGACCFLRRQQKLDKSTLRQTDRSRGTCRHSQNKRGALPGGCGANYWRKRLTAAKFHTSNQLKKRKLGRPRIAGNLIELNPGLEHSVIPWLPQILEHKTKFRNQLKQRG